jgi:hypothetical protein
MAIRRRPCEPGRFGYRGTNQTPVHGASRTRAEIRDREIEGLVDAAAIRPPHRSRERSVQTDRTHVDPDYEWKVPRLHLCE